MRYGEISANIYSDYFICEANESLLQFPRMVYNGGFFYCFLCIRADVIFHVFNFYPR